MQSVAMTPMACLNGVVPAYQERSGQCRAAPSTPPASRAMPVNQIALGTTASSSGRDAQIEDSHIGGVRDEQPDYLTPVHRRPVVSFAIGEHHVAKVTHRGAIGLRLAEQGNHAVLDQDVVEHEHELTIHRPPVRSIARVDDDVPIQPMLLRVVFPNVRVVPEQTGVRKAQVVGEPAAGGDWRLHPMMGAFRYAVEAVVQPQPVPVHR